MDVKEELEKIFILYFQDESKKKLLKNKEFDILANELSDLFMNKKFNVKCYNSLQNKLLKNLLKDEFKKTLKNYREV